VALEVGWGFRAASLSYQAVGFGSHHWLAEDARGNRLFLTVDDLTAKLGRADDSADAAFGRLDRAFRTAVALRRDGGLEFVLAPVLAGDGRVLHRLQDRYSLVVHPYLADCRAVRDGQFETSSDRLAVLDLLTALHGARVAPGPLADDFTIPLVDELREAMRQTAEPWLCGPYGSSARDLLARHATDLALLLAAYDDLAVRVAGRPDRMVITHGEPDAANVLKTSAGFVFVDWESVLLAAPERDLWQLAERHPSALAAYSTATGIDIDQDALALYRMWYDLFEIVGYIALFRQPHADTADSAESWRNLQHFLRPAHRWPGLLSGLSG